MKTFAFETKTGFRFDVKSSTPQSAYKKIKSIPYLLEMITGNYFKYGKDGLHSFCLGWETIKEV